LLIQQQSDNAMLDAEPQTLIDIIDQYVIYSKQDGTYGNLNAGRTWVMSAHCSYFLNTHG